MNDFKLAFRQLGKSPGFSLVAVLTLALGIGLSTTIFNGVNPLLFRSLPFADPSTLVWIHETSPKQGLDRMPVSYADYAHWKQENTVFSGIEAWDTISLTLTGRENAERLSACDVTATLFRTLGLRPAKGRDFRPDEDNPGSAPVAIIGDRIWERFFNRSDDVLGQTMMLNGTAHTVVGIMPRGIRFPHDADVWTPLVIEDRERTHGRFSYYVAARLKQGVSREQASSEVLTIQARIAKESPTTNTHVGAQLRPIEDAFVNSELRMMGWMMLGSVVFVLAVACANVASLFLTRALGRQKEFAVRAALGAGRWRVVRQLLAESLVLGLLGGVVGFLLSIWGVDVVLKLVPVEIPYWLDFSIDWRVFAFTAGASLLTSILFGLAPALQASRTDVLESLNDANRGSSGGRRRHRLRSAFVVSEVAVASVLLCGTALMLRSLFNLQRANPGFNPANASVFFMNVSGGMDSSPGARAAFYARLLNRLRGLPDVTAAAACSALPLSGRYSTQVYAVEGRPPPEAGANPVANLRVVSPGYFHAMEIPLLAGREFTEADNATSPKVLILDATFARQQFGTENPIGKRIRWNHNDPTSSREIVGIAGDVKHGTIDGQIRPGFYMPYAQNPRPTMGIVVRTASEQPSGLLATIRQTVRELDPSLAIYEAQTLQQMIAETFWVRRYLGRLLIGFAALALGLAAVGVASVVAFSVTQRTHEIGIRMALGAVPADVLTLILAQGLRMVLVGLAIGLAASVALTRVLASQLYGIGVVDVPSLTTSGVLFLSVAILACWLPARRATRVNPVNALRAE